ncbi:MAG TPA: hypothetical protein VIF09_07060, partial [Polyangiaceae bacterium]
MHRAVSLALSALALASSVAACATHAEAVPEAEGPTQARAPVASAAPPEPAPNLTLASFAKDPASPSDPLASAHPSCPGEMVLIEGDYCTEVKEECVEWEDPPSNKLARCAKFAPTQCVGEHVHKRFCVDRDEYTPRGDALPAGDVSWTQAKDVCDKEK